MIRHYGPISGVATDKSKYVATAGYDNQIIIWDAESKTPLSRAYHDHLVNSCTFSKDGLLLATASSDYTARIWSVPELRLLSVLGDHEDDVEMLAFHPTKGIIATASRDHKVRIFNLKGELLQKLTGHTADVISVAWLSCGEKLISSSDDGTLKIWQFGIHQAIQSIDLDGVEVDTVVTDTKGRIYSGNDNGEIVVITASSAFRIKAHRSGIKRLVIDEDSFRILSLGYDRKLALWEIKEEDGRSLSLHLQSKFDLPVQVWPRTCAFYSSDKLIFGSFGSSYITLEISSGQWDMNDVLDNPCLNAVAALDQKLYAIGDAGILVSEGQKQQELGSLCNFLCPIEDSHLVTGGQMGILFDALGGEKIYQHMSPLNCAATFLCNHESMLAVGAYTGELLIFKFKNLKYEYIQSLNVFNNAIKGVSADDEQIFCVCATGAAAWVSISDLTIVKTNSEAHDKIANGCTKLNYYGFASVSRDLKLRIWNNSGGSYAADVIETPHQHSIKCIASDNTGELIATGAYDGFIHVYNIAKRCWVYSARPTCAGISSLCYSYGNFFASSYDGNIYTLDLNKLEHKSNIQSFLLRQKESTV